MFTWVLAMAAEPPQPAMQPLVRVIDLNIGRSSEVELSDGRKATVGLLALLALNETCDDRGAVSSRPNGICPPQERDVIFGGNTVGQESQPGSLGSFSGASPG
jgi:hypothetical protein